MYHEIERAWRNRQDNERCPYDLNEVPVSKHEETAFEAGWTAAVKRLNTVALTPRRQFEDGHWYVSMEEVDAAAASLIGGKV